MNIIYKKEGEWKSVLTLYFWPVMELKMWCYVFYCVLEVTDNENIL